MIRVLVIIAVAGFVVSLGSLMGAAAIAGPDALAGKGWNWAGGHPWRFVMDHDEGRGDRSSGPAITRTFTWGGGDTLRVSAAAEIRYTQRAGPASLTITGPAAALDRVSIDAGEISLHGRAWRHGKISIALAAPEVSRFRMSGANRLTIEAYDQDSLSLDLSGASEVEATGKTREIDLEISGAGEADLGALKAREADVEISGAGKATLAPTDRARIDISGMGDVKLLTHPAQLETDISGAGRVRQADPVPTAAPAPAPDKAV